MRPVFVSTLLHDLTADPGMWVDIHDENRALLFDLADLGGMPTRKIMRVERAFVTHTHIDHFIGFDRLMRSLLRRERPLELTGPAGFLRNVQGKIDGYTWNLIREYPTEIVVHEIDGDVVRSARFDGANGLQPDPLPDRPFSGTVHAERLFTVHAVELDHRVPVLGFALRETERISVNPDRVEKMGLKPGPWLRELKQAVRRCEPLDTPITAETLDGGERPHTVGDLEPEILIRGPGQTVGYLTDFAGTADNLAKAAALVQGVDLLICEATFLHDDRDLARDRAHLTARQAGELARAAGARRLVPFHVSPRYKGREDEVVQEAAAAFGGPTRTVPWVVPPPDPIYD